MSTAAQRPPVNSALDLMKTCLDDHHELELDGHRYDGDRLVAEVWELVVGERRTVVRGGTYYHVTFHRPVAHAVTEEFPAAVAGLVQGRDEGFLRIIENPALTSALGLNGDPFGEVRSYALITAHEVLVVYCCEEPTIEKHNV